MSVIPPIDLVGDEPQICVSFNIEWRRHVLGLLDRASPLDYWDDEQQAGSDGILEILARIMEASEGGCEMARLPRIVQQNLTGAADRTVSVTSAADITDYTELIEYTVYESHVLRFDYAYDFNASSGGTNSFLNVVLSVRNVDGGSPVTYDLGRHWSNNTVEITAFGYKHLHHNPGTYEAKCQFYRTSANCVLKAGKLRGLGVVLYDLVPE